MSGISEAQAQECAQLPAISAPQLGQEGNFLLIDSDVPPGAVCDALFERDILARDVSRYPMLGRCFRVNVGKPDENTVVIDALADVMAELRRAG